MDLNTTPAFSASTPYGRACISCAKAKSKCLTSGAAGGKCDRCHRLEKQCLPAPTVRKRGIAKSTPATKTARLEEKLDGLVSLLQSASKALPIVTGNVAAETQIQLSPESLQSPRSDPPSQGVLYAGDDPDLHLARPVPVMTGAILGSTVNYSLTANFARGFSPSLREASERLQRFQVLKAKHFPFILLPETMTAVQLREERPFVWLCIMAVSAESSVQWEALALEIRTIACHQLLVEGQRSVDILLGLLIYIAWGQSYFHRKPLLHILVQLAVGLLAELNLNKQTPKESSHVMLNYDARGCPKPCNPSTRTQEERRAAIACYSLSLSMSAYFQKIDPPRWTAYLTDCLRHLAKNEGCQSDRLLACLVQLNQITDKIVQAPWHDGSAELLSSRAPATFYLKALEAQLENFKKAIPSDLLQNETLLLNIHNMTLTIHEIALSHSPIFSITPDSLRLDSLYICLDATKSWFDIFLKIPPAQYIGFPITILMQMAHCVIALYRLSTFSDATVGWDVGLVRQTLDLSAVLEALVGIVGRVKSEAGLVEDGTEENDAWCSTEKRLAGIKSWWDGKVQQEAGGIQGLRAGGVEAEEEMLMGEFWDDSWLDVLGLRDYQF